MSSVRTIRQLPRLSRLMKAEGGVHARTALDHAKSVLAANRAANLISIDETLDRMGEWRALPAPSATDWRALQDASAGIIGLCDPEADVHLLRAARLLCEYIDRASQEKWSKNVGALFINTLKAVAAQDADLATRSAVLRGLEALIPLTSD